MNLYCRNELVGQLTDAISDMWYLEGNFTPVENSAGASFTERAALLDPSAAMIDQTKAIRAQLRESGDGEEMLFLVMSLSAGRLFGRRVVQPEAIQWVLSNVPD